MKSSGIGGQAVIEGVMMKNNSKYAVAVRRPDQEIEVKVSTYQSAVKWKALTGIPFIRGVFNFIDSLVLGMQTLTFSASFYEEDEEPTKADKAAEKLFGDKAEKLIMGCTVAVSILAAIAIFMLLPYFISNFFRTFIISNTLVALLEGVIRLVIFMLYITLISLMKDIQRVFMYHGAEHKCINCIEHGLELTVENVRKSSKQHKRCGTSFMLIVMVVSIIFFIFIQVESPVLRVVIRILLIPVIAGVSYEFIRLAGRSENRLVTVLSKPGLWLQNLTTREPDDSMIEVAVASVEAVFDWREYLSNNNFPAKKAAAEEKEQKQEDFDGVPEVKEYALSEEKEAEGKESRMLPDTDGNLLEAPRIISALFANDTTVKVKWNKLKSADGYVLYRKTGEDDHFTVFNNIEKNYFTDTGLTPGNTYYYKIRGYRQAEGKKVYGRYSPIEPSGYDSKVKSKY